MTAEIETDRKGRNNFDARGLFLLILVELNEELVVGGTQEHYVQ